jgi:hypothetical protein
LAQAQGNQFSGKYAHFIRLLRASPPLFAYLDPAASALAVFGDVYADTASAELGGVKTGARPPCMGRGTTVLAPQRGSLAQVLGYKFVNKPALFVRVLHASPPLYYDLDPAASALAVFGDVYADTASAELGGVETGARPPSYGRGARQAALQLGSLAQAMGVHFCVKRQHFMRVLHASPPLFAYLDPAASALAVLGPVYADTVSAELGGVEKGTRPQMFGRGARQAGPQRGSLAQWLGVQFSNKSAPFVRVLGASPPLYSSPPL